MLSANSSRALAPMLSMEVIRVGSLFLVLAAVPWNHTTNINNQQQQQQQQLQHHQTLHRLPMSVPGVSHVSLASLVSYRRSDHRSARPGTVRTGRPGAYLEGAVEVRLGVLQVLEDGEDGEDGRVVVPHDGPARRRHDVVSLQHQVVQRLLWRGGGRSQGKRQGPGENPDCRVCA